MNTNDATTKFHPSRVKRPVINDLTIKLGERVGSSKHGSAVWRLHCQCGKHFDVATPLIKKGWYRCPVCQPKPRDHQTAAILAALPGTIPEIMAKTNMTRWMARNRLREMHKDGKIKVGAWRRASTNGNPMPVFHKGPGKDKPCTLPRMTVAEMSRRYRESIAGTEQHDAMNARKRANYHADKAAQVGDPLVLALFGRRAPANDVREAA